MSTILTSFLQLHGTPIMCLFCKESVLDNYLELHIKYDHKIGHEVAVAQLLAMHFPGKSNKSKSSTETNKQNEFCQENDSQEEILRPPDPERWGKNILFFILIKYNFRASVEKIQPKKTERKSHQRNRKDKPKEESLHIERYVFDQRFFLMFSFQ